MKLSDALKVLQPVIDRLDYHQREALQGPYVPIAPYDTAQPDWLQRVERDRMILYQVARFGQRSASEIPSGIGAVLKRLSSDSNLREVGVSASHQLEVELRRRPDHPISLADLAYLLRVACYYSQWLRSSERDKLAKSAALDVQFLSSKLEEHRRLGDLDVDEVLTTSFLRETEHYRGPLIHFRGNFSNVEPSPGVRISRLPQWDWADDVVHLVKGNLIQPDTALSITHTLQVESGILRGSEKDRFPRLPDFDEMDDLHSVVDVVAAASGATVFAPEFRLVSPKGYTGPWLQWAPGVEGREYAGSVATVANSMVETFKTRLNRAFALWREEHFRKAYRALRQGERDPELEWRLVRLFEALQRFTHTDGRLVSLRAAWLTATDQSGRTKRFSDYERVRGIRNSIVHSGRTYETLSREEQKIVLDGIRWLEEALFAAFATCFDRGDDEKSWRVYLDSLLFPASPEVRVSEPA